MIRPYDPRTKSNVIGEWGIQAGRISSFATSGLCSFFAVDQMTSHPVKQKEGASGFDRYGNYPDLLLKAQRKFEKRAIVDIDYSKSIFLVLGLLDEDEEKMRLYFLSHKDNLTAEERAHFVLLSYKILHRVAEVADEDKGNEDISITCDDGPHSEDSTDDEEQTLHYLSCFNQREIQVELSGCLLRRRKRYVDRRRATPILFYE